MSSNGILFVEIPWKFFKHVSKSIENFLFLSHQLRQSKEKGNKKAVILDGSRKRVSIDHRLW